MAESKIVAATGTASGSTRPNLKPHMIQDAMSAAVTQCAKEGITDPKEILKRKLEAREKIKKG